ncbi:hypothetical protein LAZ67_12001674 [Cordylochernes scorpioides]|uniref:Reverse transcriptase domain-containing protein n=1 Tax=Cordylochernes scorpioides TaxID=51811 RepID=A0ABY6L180_9ARAC|nr:hypothetical protein LAZ67_12001674 [Cordylochernes scorpioides]
MPKNLLELAPAESPSESKRLSSKTQASPEKSAKIGFQKKTSKDSQEISKHANLPAGEENANSAAADGIVGKPSSNGAEKAAKNWADRMEEEEKNEDGYTVVRNKKRHRDSGLGDTTTTQTSRATSTAPRRRTTGTRLPQVQEIRATRAHIADARVRQAFSTQEQCAYFEYCPDFSPYQYLESVDKVVGGPKNIIQLTRMNGHVLVGLTTKAFAGRLIDGGLEIERTTLRTFPFRKRVEKIIIGNLPFFVEDATIIEALRPYGRVTSIAPMQFKVWYTLPAFLTFGIKCSKCNKQSHRRANFPMLARQTTGARKASTSSPTDAKSPTAPQQPRQPAPAPAAPGLPTPRGVMPIEALAGPYSTAPQPALPAPPAPPAIVAPPPSLPAPRTFELETAPMTIEMMDVENRGEENTGSSIASQRSVIRPELDNFLEKAPSSLYAETDQLGLDREEILRALASKTEIDKLMPKLTAAQNAAITRLTDLILEKRPGSPPLCTSASGRPSWHLEERQNELSHRHNQRALYFVISSGNTSDSRCLLVELLNSGPGNKNRDKKLRRTSGTTSSGPPGSCLPEINALHVWPLPCRASQGRQSLVLSTIQHHLHAYLLGATIIFKLQTGVARFIRGPDHTTWLPAGILERPVLLDLPIIGGCRFLRPPNLLAPADWVGARVRNLGDTSIVRPTRSALADAAALAAFCRKIVAENLQASFRESSLAEAIVLRGTTRTFTKITTRSARRALERPCLAALPITRLLVRWEPIVNVPARAWIFGTGLEDDELAILASSKSRIYRYFVQVGLGEVIEDPVVAWMRTLSRQIRPLLMLTGMQIRKRLLANAFHLRHPKVYAQQAGQEPDGYSTRFYRLSDHRAVFLQLGSPPTAGSPGEAVVLKSAAAIEQLSSYIEDVGWDAEDLDDGELWSGWNRIKAEILAEIRSFHTTRPEPEDDYVTRAKRYIRAPSLPDLGRTHRLRRRVATIVRDEEGEIISDRELRSGALSFFRHRLAQDPADPAEVDNFIAGTTSIIIEEDDPLHRSDISREKIAAAIRTLPTGKAPGWDSLPCEILFAYEYFFLVLLWRVFGASFVRGALPSYSRRGSICLLPKARSGPGLAGFRPITLPSTDYRVLAAILMRCLRPHLPTLAIDCQTYTITGRSPSWNIARITVEVEITTAGRLPLAFVSVDLESAIDSMDRGFLMSLLVSLGQPPALIRWIQLLYAGAMAAVRIGEHHTAAFPLLNGVRQGCAESAALFSLAPTPLLRRLQSALGEGNVLAYADNIVLMVRREEHFVEVASIFQGFQRASGIRENFRKIVGLWWGAWRARVDSPLDISWTDTSLRILGCDIRPRASAAMQEGNLLDILDAAFRRWAPFNRGLSLVGRARAANCLVLSSFMHHLHGYIPTDSSISKLRARLVRLSVVPASVLSRPISLGGFGLLDLSTQMRVACIKGWCLADSSSTRDLATSSTSTAARSLGGASEILALNHRVLPPNQFSGLTIIGGCRFLPPPDLLVASQWVGARVGNLIGHGSPPLLRVTHAALAYEATLSQFTSRLLNENCRGSYLVNCVGEAFVLRGTATPFQRLTTRTVRRMLERPRLAALPFMAAPPRPAPHHRLVFASKVCFLRGQRRRSDTTGLACPSPSSISGYSPGVLHRLWVRRPITCQTATGHVDGSGQSSWRPLPSSSSPQTCRPGFPGVAWRTTPWPSFVCKGADI